MPYYEKSSIDLYCFPSGPIGTNAYLIICKTTKQAAIIDPAEGSFLKVKRACEQHSATLQKLICTHTHWDHIVDAAKYVKEFSIPVLVHTEDAYNLKNPGADRIPSMVAIEAVEPTHLLREHDVLFIGESRWQVIHTPGHSPGGICLYCEQEQTLIAGDTLFRGSIGRLDIPTGQPERMWSSLKKLSLLPPDTKVFPGHGPTTTIRAESWLARAEEFFGQ